MSLILETSTTPVFCCVAQTSNSCADAKIAASPSDVRYGWVANETACPTFAGVELILSSTPENEEDGDELAGAGGGVAATCP